MAPTAANDSVLAPNANVLPKTTATTIEGAATVLQCQNDESKLATALSAKQAPIFNTLDEILTTRIDELVRYSATQSNEDRVVFMDETGQIHSASASLENVSERACIAGSSAVRELQNRLATRALHLKLDKTKVFRSVLTRQREGWIPNDNDVFVLQQSPPARYKFGQVDLVHVPEASVSELLLGFDLPCCRAAVDVQGRLWFSLHCLSSLITGYYIMPKHLESERGCVELVQRAHAQHTNPSDHIGVVRNEESKLLDAKFAYQRTRDRTAKYANERGIVPKYVDMDTTTVPQWIYLRFVKRFQTYIADPNNPVAPNMVDEHKERGEPL